MYSLLLHALDAIFLRDVALDRSGSPALGASALAVVSASVVVVVLAAAEACLQPSRGGFLRRRLFLALRLRVRSSPNSEESVLRERASRAPEQQSKSTSQSMPYAIKMMSP